MLLLQHGIGNIPNDDPDHIIAIQHGIGNIPDYDPHHIVATGILPLKYILYPSKASFIASILSIYHNSLFTLHF
jgi:hypothetical protein